MNRRLGAKWRARELAAAVRDYLVHVHVELRAATRHPNMQGEHVLMLAGKNLVTSATDQGAPLIVQAAPGMVRIGGGLFQNRVGGDHFPGYEVRSDGEVLKRALGLRTPQLIGCNWHVTQGVLLDSHIRIVHGFSRRTHDAIVLRQSEASQKRAPA
jgi:hypothetical protein